MAGLQRMQRDNDKCVRLAHNEPALQSKRSYRACNAAWHVARMYAHLWAAQDGADVLDLHHERGRRFEVLIPFLFVLVEVAFA